MTSESLRIEHDYPAGHRNRHVPRVCPRCGAPETSDGSCTHCVTTPPAPERLGDATPDGRARLRRMEQVASH
jgi:hypothetical protein